MKRSAPMLREWSVVVLSLLSVYAHAGTSIVEPEWNFEDDFEGVEDTTFWKGGVRNTYGTECSSDAEYDSNVLRFNYQINTTGNSFSEKRMALPVARQIEINYDLFVPANYIRSSSNHKNFAFWSGDYGTEASNISLVSESWPVDTGGHPSFKIGEDGNNYGHSGVAGGKGTVINLNNSGAWHKISIYMELAEYEGDFGVMEIWRDGELIVATHMEEVSASWGQPSVSEHIAYSSRGNFIDQGYILGWSNGGFSEETIFCVDNFSIKTRSTVGTKRTKFQPNPPHSVVVKMN